jgi:hypothetical protein
MFTVASGVNGRNWRKRSRSIRVLFTELPSESQISLAGLIISPRQYLVDPVDLVVGDASESFS